VEARAEAVNEAGTMVSLVGGDIPHCREAAMQAFEARSAIPTGMVK